MNWAQAQVLTLADTEQPEGLRSRYNSQNNQAPQRQSFGLDFNTYYDRHIKGLVAEVLAGNKGKIPVSRILFWALLTLVIVGGFWIGLAGKDRIANVITTFKNSPALLPLITPLLAVPTFVLLRYRKLFFPGKNARTAQSEKLGSIIIPEIFRYLDNGCTFNRNPTLTASDIDFLGDDPSQNGLLALTTPRLRYHCHDEVVGTRNGISFKMLEVEIEQEVKSKKSRSNYYSTIFSGVYLLVDVPKSFKGRVDIRRNYEKFMGALPGVFSNMKRVRLEDPDFEKVFDVYSDNQIEARYLMTTTMMQSLNDLRFVLGGKSLVGRFYNGQLALRIASPHDLFEINCGVEEEEYREEAKKIIDDLNSIFNAIDTMDLNTQSVV